MASFASFEMEHHRLAIERKIRLNMASSPQQPVLCLGISCSTSLLLGAH